MGGEVSLTAQHSTGLWLVTTLLRKNLLVQIDEHTISHCLVVIDNNVR
jgi:hypothetical protein